MRMWGEGGIQSLQMLFAALGEEGGTEISSRPGRMLCGAQPPVWSVFQGKSHQVQRMDGLGRQGTLPDNPQMQPDSRSCNKTLHRTVAASSILNRCKLILYKTMLLTKPLLMAHWRELESCSVLGNGGVSVSVLAGFGACSWVRRICVLAVPLQGQEEAEEQPQAPHRVCSFLMSAAVWSRDLMRPQRSWSKITFFSLGAPF